MNGVDPPGRVPEGETVDAPAPEAAAGVPFSFAKRFGVLVQHIDDVEARVLYRHDAASSALLEVRRLVGRPIAFSPTEPSVFEAELQKTYEQRTGQTQKMMDDLGEAMDLAEVAGQLSEPADLLEKADDAPIIRLINALLAEAIRENASDIHIEPFEERLVVRLRVDGILRQVMEPPRGLAPLIASRIKVMAKLDIAEKRLPQDGRISIRIANRPVDVRVSTLPSGYGERVVLRLLDKQAGRLTLEQLGMDADKTRVMEDLIRRPHGILLVTGPTGSGKTTTLYAALTRLRKVSRNIMTVEDPIEYYLDGIAQTQVNTKVEMTFARGLRSILRQDPDVVMVGEIRDEETAQIAVQASLTGHFVLSTLHTNSAVGAITRLRDMGVEQFLLASSLVGVLAQRLVRVLCPVCKEAYAATPGDRAWLHKERCTSGIELYRTTGCRECNHSGYRGRTSIYELVAVDAQVREMIHEGAGEQAIERYMRLSSPSIQDSGQTKVRAGITTVEEVVRVTRDA